MEDLFAELDQRIPPATVLGYSEWPKRSPNYWGAYMASNVPVRAAIAIAVVSAFLATGLTYYANRRRDEQRERESGTATWKLSRPSSGRLLVDGGLPKRRC